MLLHSQCSHGINRHNNCILLIRYAHGRCRRYTSMKGSRWPVIHNMTQIETMQDLCAGVLGSHAGNAEIQQNIYATTRLARGELVIDYYVGFMRTGLGQICIIARSTQPNGRNFEKQVELKMFQKMLYRSKRYKQSLEMTANERRISA